MTRAYLWLTRGDANKLSLSQGAGIKDARLSSKDLDVQGERGMMYIDAVPNSHIIQNA